MHEVEQHDGNSVNAKGNKIPQRWPDYFSWMVKIAEKLVGKNDAEDVANAALYDVCCSDRPRPPIEHREEAERLLRHLIWLRARAFWKTRKRRRPEVLTSFDKDELQPEFDVGGEANVVYSRLMLTQMLADMSVLDRQLLWGFVVEGFTAKQLANLFKMNPHTVDSRIRRLLPKVAKCVADGRPKQAGLPGIALVWTKEQWQKARSLWAYVREAMVTKMNWGRIARSLVYSAPLAVLPGHALATEPAVAADLEPQWPSFVIPAGMMFVCANDAGSIPESPGSRIRSAQHFNVPKKTSSAALEIEDSSPVEMNRKIPVEVVEAPAPDECQYSLGLAIAKKNTGHLTQCLEVLDALRTRDPVCGRTEDWRLLNDACNNR